MNTARPIQELCNTALVASQNAALNQMVAFIASTLFDEQSNKRELLLMRTMFLPIARITLVPRDRPILASIIDLDELFRVRSEILHGTGKWVECFRLHEESVDDSIRIHVNMSTTMVAPHHPPRTADILFAVKTAGAGRWIIRSCTVVYDEAGNARSPVTLIS